jgi:dipicolinate synthase subunit A
MLTGVYVMVVGGDQRQLEVIEKLLEWDANVKIVGFEQESLRTNDITKVDLTIDECASTDILVLPITGISDTGIIDAKYSNHQIRLGKQHIAVLPEHATVFTGFASPYLKMLCDEVHVKVVELLKCDEVAIFNSIPTAEGAVAMAIEHTDVTIHSSKTVVLGFGRVGMTLARLLKAMGADVKVGVQFPEQFARAFEMGLQPFYTDVWNPHANAIDLLFNTIPSMIISAQVIASLNQQTVIIDLASKPGGTDFRFAEKRHMKAILAPSLPGIVAPKTAGLLIAATLSQMISADLKERT